MQAGPSGIMVLALVPLLAGCGSKNVDPAHRPHVAESTDPSGMEYVPRPLLADDVDDALKHTHHSGRSPSGDGLMPRNRGQ